MTQEYRVIAAAQTAQTILDERTQAEIHRQYSAVINASDDYRRMVHFSNDT